jgi:neuronal guanine nucleotide exchange factor
MTLLQNHENKTVEWLVAFNTECERRRWIESFVSQSSKNPEEKIYEDWDCPIVEAVVSVKPKDAGEISLEQGEKASVLRKLSDSGKTFFEFS